MAGQLINSQIDSTGGTTTTLNWRPAKNNLLVVLTTISSVGAPAAITDNQSNIYSKPQEVNDSTDGDWATLYYTVLTGTGSSFIITHPANNSIVIAEIYGIDRVNPLHTSSGTTAQNTAVTFNLTLTSDNIYVIGGGWSNGTTANTPGSGYSKIQEQIDDVTHERCYMQAGLKNNGTVAFNYTVPANGWVSVAGAFNAANPNSNLNINKGLRPHPFSPGLAR